MNRIFIQIASYRDPQLLPTIRNAMAMAEHPENLIFSIARQFCQADGFDSLEDFRRDKRFRILDIPHTQSKGVCWARNLLQKKYRDEEYTFQIDSHMRFEENWDTILINMINDLQKKGYKKPLLTCYAPAYDPDNDPNGRTKEVWRLAFDRFIPEGAIFSMPEIVPNEEPEPFPTRFYSAHFCFTLGQFCKEVPHDPNLYFHGEEISIAVRAFTHGYDLFSPNKIVAWHEYIRKGRVKQWDDDKTWRKRNQLSHLRNRKLLSMDGEVYNKDEFREYGLGEERTLRDYEKYAGILFSKRSVQFPTLMNDNPPNPYDFKTEEEWLKSFRRIFKHCIDIYKDKIPRDCDMWSVTYYSSDGKEIYREDADKEEIQEIMNEASLHNDRFYKIWRDFYAPIEPGYWEVSPHSVSSGWGEKITGSLKPSK